MAEESSGDTNLRNRQPWEVFEREGFQRPPNELRYAGFMRLALIALALSIAVIGLVIPAVSRQMQFRDTVAQAKADGLPQVPPSQLIRGGQQFTDYLGDWNLSCDSRIAGVPLCDYVMTLSDQRGDYEDTYTSLALGFTLGYFLILIALAISFARALQNVYALGFPMSTIPPAWAFIGFFIPIINLFIPWLVVNRVWRTSWSKDGQETAGPLNIIGIAWGVAEIITVFLNPQVTGMIIRRTSISAWMLNLQWVSIAELWVAAMAVLTSLLLVTISRRQRRRYALLDAAAYA